ncbi:hypothetical protein Fmac_016516 [Flemingia macrophylla]|uniref:Protein GAMETE EXPRESSED 3 n=1 Tax=Flemingia macrophylla TaxID=520843 RepID=A0ABD1MHN6_9FABA
MHLDYKCNLGTAPVHGGHGKVYLVADNRILVIKYGSIGTSEPEAEVFFGPGPGKPADAEIIGLSVSTLGSNVYINVKNRGLFAYQSHGHLLWSVGPVLYKFGYRQGCRKNLTDCYFASVPVLDQCEASIYISNTEGELYCLSLRSRYFRWIQDFSSFDKNFTITPGNNGQLYVTVPAKALVLALDVFSGNVLWQRSIGPLSKVDSAPVVDSNGWISIGSLDGFLYSFSPNGVLKKFSRMNAENSMVQVGPFLDCSGYAVYISQIEMEGKVSHAIGEYTVVSAVRPKAALFTMMVPATGSIYWSENYPGTCFSIRSLHLAALKREPSLSASTQCSLRLKKKALDRTIAEMEKKAAEETVENEVFEKLGDIVRERECIERKLSTTYSLGRDRTDSQPKSMLPVQMGKTKSYSFQDAKQKNMTTPHILSDASSSESSTQGETSILEVEGMDSSTMAKAHAPLVETSSTGEVLQK